VNQKQKRVFVGVVFAVGLAAFWQLIQTEDSQSGKFDVNSFLLESAIILTIGIVYVVKSKSN